MKTQSKHLFDIIRFRVGVDLRGEISNSYIGWMWWLLEPLMYLAAFYLIFDVIFQRGGPGFIGFLLCGLIFWRWFDASVKKSSSSILSNAQLIQQVPVPKIIFPLTDLGASFFRFLMTLGIFLPFLLFYQGGIPLSALNLPLLLITQALLICGTSLLLAAVIPFAPDLKKLLDHVMTVMFFLSGIFFSINKLPEAHQQLLYLNPMAILIEQYRFVLLDNLAPDYFQLAKVAALGLLLLLVGLKLIRRYDSFYASQIS